MGQASQSGHQAERPKQPNSTTDGEWRPQPDQCKHKHMQQTTRPQAPHTSTKLDQSHIHGLCKRWPSDVTHTRLEGLQPQQSKTAPPTERAAM